MEAERRERRRGGSAGKEASEGREWSEKEGASEEREMRGALCSGESWSREQVERRVQ